MFGALMGAVGGAIGLGGSLLAGQAQQRQGSEDRKIARYNAQLMDQRAASVEQASDTQTELLHERSRRSSGTREAGYTSSGADTSGGTPLMVMAEMRANEERDILQGRQNASLDAQRLRGEAQMLRRGGEQARRAGRNNKFSTILGGVGQFASSLSEFEFGGGGGKAPGISDSEYTSLFPGVF